VPGRAGRLAGRIITLRCRPGIRRHRLGLRRWRGPAFTIAVLSDLHVAAPWTSLAAIARVVRQVNALQPEMVVLAGDFLAEPRIPGRRAAAEEIAAVLAPLQADAGVFAVLGNHDWADCPLAPQTGWRYNSVIAAFRNTPIRLLRNRARPVAIGTEQLWVVGLDSQRPPPEARRPGGLHDPERAFAPVPPEAPAILLAHEPGYFARGDTRAGLQISGHTHGGQLNLFGWRPLLRKYPEMRFAHGLLRSGSRMLVVSAGLGFSGVPLRIGQPPEITLIEILPEAGAERSGNAT